MMNYRPIANLCQAQLWRGFSLRLRLIMPLLLAALLLTACWGDDEAQPSGDAPLSALPTSATITDGATATEATTDGGTATETTVPAENAAENTAESDAEATPAGIAALSSTPAPEGEVTATLPAV